MPVFKPAQRKQAKMRLAVAGPSGSGKTYSALLIARGLVGPEGKIAVIDTERGSASLYADLTPFDVCELAPPFTPERYIEAIRAAEAAGYDAIIIDGLSHAWAGPGGVLDLHDAAAAKEKNSYTAWRLVTPRHNDLVDAMLQSKCHIIATMRSKTEYAQVEEGGKKKVVKLGMAPVQRDGMEYEFTVFLDLDASHNAVASKDRTSIFDGLVFRPTEETGRKLREWLEGAFQEPQPQASGQKAGEPQATGSQEAGKQAETGKQAEAGKGQKGKKSNIESFSGQMVVIGQPVQTEKGWEVKAVDMKTEEELTLVGDAVKDLAEAVYQVRGQRAQNRVKVGEIKPADAQAQAETQAETQNGQAVTAIIRTAPKKTIRSKNGAAEEVIWCRAEVEGCQVILTGNALLGLNEGQAVTLIASPTGEKAASGEEILNVREVRADASAA
jgi:hypothetical protein